MIELKGLGLSAPDGCAIGVIADDPAVVRSSVAEADAVRVGPGEEFSREGRALIFDHTFSRSSAIDKALALAAIRDMCRAKASILLLSHDEQLLEAASDEIWVFRQGALVDRGDPAEVLRRYRKSVGEQLRAAGEGKIAPVSPTMRKGDGRAVLGKIELLGEAGTPTIVWKSGEAATVRVNVTYPVAVAEPVVGMMIRTRIGLNVYGTNTELEQVRVGPVAAGATRIVSFRFPCNLCPGEYTLTAASHDPDGLWHEWLEDAVAFTVTDSRYTAGVANLRARVQVE